MPVFNRGTGASPSLPLVGAALLSLRACAQAHRCHPRRQGEGDGEVCSLERGVNVKRRQECNPISELSSDVAVKGAAYARLVCDRWQLCNDEGESCVLGVWFVCRVSA